MSMKEMFLLFIGKRNNFIYKSIINVIIQNKKRGSQMKKEKLEITKNNYEVIPNYMIPTFLIKRMSLEYIKLS